jgi:hypothetical protein
MVTPIVIAIGSLPTAHPAYGPQLAARPEDELVQRRIQRRTREAQMKLPRNASDASGSMRARPAA